MLPRIQPIAPVRRNEAFDDPGWLFDFKYDGFRGLCYLGAGRGELRRPHRVRLQSTRGASLTGSSVTTLTIPRQELKDELLPQHCTPSGFTISRVGFAGEICK